MIKIALLASGNGSNAEAIIKHFGQHPNIKIVCFSDNEDAKALERAKNLDIEAIYLPFEQNFEYFSQNPFDLYVLAGYMRVLPTNILDLGTFINIHPSLLPAFKGKEAIKQAYEHGVKVTGVTVHYVSEEVDSGKIIAQTPVMIDEGMNLAELETKIHEVEHQLYPLVIESFLYDKIVDFLPQKSGCGCKSNDKGCGGKCGH
ncbi:MAG: phosphoribosylglycinamide formyltransferase [bacterium]